MAIRHLHYMGRRILCSGAPLGLLLGWSSTSPLCAQTSARAEAVPGMVATAAAPTQRLYWKRNVIQLPIQINDQYRDMIREVQLFVKDQPGAPWAMRDKLGSSQKAFTFVAPRDGEFAFTMVTVDRQGRRIPADLNAEPPGLVVVFDTQRPKIELGNLGFSQEGQLIRYEAMDINLDHARSRLFFQGGDKQFRPLEQVPGQPHVYCIPTRAVFTGVIRATAEDLAGNQATVDATINSLPNLNTTASLPPVKADVTPTPESPAPNLFPQGVGQIPPADDPVPYVQPKTNPDVIAANPGPRQGTEGPREVIQTTNSTPVPSQMALSVNHTETSKRHLVNQTKVLLDYQVENVGSSGLGRIEVWLTRDQGKTWIKNCEVPHAKSPVEVQLPDEGKYGVTLVAVNAKGVGGDTPVAGTAPDWSIEVDLTKPATNITKIDVQKEHGETVVHIAWSTQDTNFGEGPVELFYSATDHGPWLPISKGLKAEGQHRWTPPTNIGVQTFIRLVAHDLAGNTSVSVTLEPVRFEDDQNRPNVRIRSVRTEGSTPDGR